jgi:hypothetical protein
MKQSLCMLQKLFNPRLLDAFNWLSTVWQIIKLNKKLKNFLCVLSLVVQELERTGCFYQELEGTGCVYKNTYVN